MLKSEQYVVRVSRGEERPSGLPDIDLFSDTEQGIAISVEGIAVPKERNTVARKVREIIHRALGLLPLRTPKEAIRDVIALTRRDLADHFSRETRIKKNPVSAHSAIIKFAWDEEAGRVVAMGDTDGGIKNYTFKQGSLMPLEKETQATIGDIFLQCSPGILNNIDGAVMNEILNFRRQHNLSLEEIRKLLIESAHNNLARLRHTPLNNPRDLSLIIMEVVTKDFSGHSVSGPTSDVEGFQTSDVLTPSVPTPEPEKPFDFSDLFLPESATRDDALVTLQLIRNRLRELGYESKIKPHHYAELPKAGNLQRAVKRAHDILEAEELREYLKSN